MVSPNHAELASGTSAKAKAEALRIKSLTLNFDDLKIPKENVLGEVGKGYKVRLSRGCVP